MTGQWLGRTRRRGEGAHRDAVGKPGTGSILLEGVSFHNLRDVRVEFRLGALNVVTGVSGSGKSSLVLGVLEPALRAHVAGKAPPTDRVGAIHVAGVVRSVVVVDESPIGRTPRSVPATYVGIWDHVRRLFAATPGARIRGLEPSHFSFNSQAGACPVCKGQGVVRVEMRLLPDVLVTCEACQGTRYRPEVLSVHYRGRNVAQVLDMTIEEAKDFFGNVPALARRLALLTEMGLGYVTLGQPSPSLSGGESQRLRLAAELTRRHGGNVYLLDEPTTGLHMADVDRLLGVLARLVEAGNTLIVVEHNLDVIAAADWVVDLGPGAGTEGGRILAMGPVQTAARSRGPTGRALRRIGFGSS